MSDEPFHSRIAALLRALAPKAKQPASATILNNWIAQAEGKLGPEAKGGRLGWLIASSVAIAAVQRAIDAHGRQLFLLKGGTLLQHRLDATARTTKDVDGLVRGDLDAFLLALEEALAEPWGPLTLRRGEVEVVDVPTKIIKPRRFDIILELRGVTWRRIQFEVSPDEAGIGGTPKPSSRHRSAGSPCASRSPRSSTPFPILTIRRTRSTTGHATSSTSSCSETPQQGLAAPHFPRSGQLASPCLKPEPRKRDNSACLRGRGRRP